MEGARAPSGPHARRGRGSPLASARLGRSRLAVRARTRLGTQGDIQSYKKHLRKQMGL